MCLTSNVGHVSHKKVPGGYPRHPVKMFFDAGLPYTLRFRIPFCSLKKKKRNDFFSLFV